MTRKYGYLCAVIACLTLGACCLPEETTIPPPPPKPDGGTPAAGLPTDLTLPQDIAVKAARARQLHEWVAADPDAVEVARQGIFAYCGGTYARYCMQPPGSGSTDPWNAWFYDQPGAQEVQIFNGAICIIASCNYWIPEVGFEAGGLGDFRQMSGMWGEHLLVKTGSDAVAYLYPDTCWRGNYTYIWPGFTSTQTINGFYKSFACFPG